MDRDQEDMQFLGLFGIYGEASKLIFRWRKIFSQITLALILPLCLVFLAHEEVSDLLYYKISFNEFVLHDTKKGTLKYHKLSDLLSTEWAEYILLKVFYFAFVLVFSLLATSAVVYTIACVYTSREITFKKVMSVVPKVWKRLIITFLCTFFAFFLYNLVLALILYLWGATIEDSALGTVVIVIVVIFYAIGFVYMTIIWQLASVVAVLEESCGFKAMIKSRSLIKGKMTPAVVIFVKLILCLVIVDFVFGFFATEWSMRMDALRVDMGTGAVCLLVMMKLILFGLVVQTVVYFVCKSYHHENIDKSALSDHLEVYSGDYVPLKAAKDVQLEEYHV